ncbi:uncharacterized protein [Bos taurus]|uniref:uncharacterized protein n=1 Tax=Bos taurus TaxID=9913 RepID=UPI0007601FB1|nr:uncharacterized protein LOC101906682 [Bos taurus]
MKQIKMNYSPGPPSHPLTSKRGMSSASDLRRDHAAVSACAEIELLFRGNQSIRRKQKWKSRFGKTCHFPDLSGAGWGRRLGRLKRGPFSHLSAFPRTSRRENDPPHLPFPTHPGSAFSPFLHLLFPSSEKSLVPELTESVPSPLPLPRGSPPHLPSHRYCHHLGSTQSIFAAGQHLLPILRQGRKKSRLQIQGCSSRREAPLPSPEPPCLVQPRRPVKRPAPGVPAWTADPGVLDPWILQGHAAQPCGGPAKEPLPHLNVLPAGGITLGLPGRPNCGSSTTLY